MLEPKFLSIFFIQKKTVRHNSCAPELGCCSKKTHPNLGEIGLELSRLEFYKFWGRKKNQVINEKGVEAKANTLTAILPLKNRSKYQKFSGGFNSLFLGSAALFLEKHVPSLKCQGLKMSFPLQRLVVRIGNHPKSQPLCLVGWTSSVSYVLYAL